MSRIVMSLVALALVHIALGVLSLLMQFVELTLKIELVVLAILAAAFIWDHLTK